jgi:hypothetical protein
MSNNLPSIFADPGAWEKNLELAQKLSVSSIVPSKYAGKPQDALVAMDIARTTGISPIEVMCNLEIIEGRPSWRAEYLAGRINSSRRFKTPIRYDFEDRPGGEFVRKTRNDSETVTLDVNRACRAWVIDQEGIRLDGPWFTCEMAVRMGLWTRGGSQWPWNTDVMLWHRAASAFQRMHCPDVMGGFAVDEYVEQAPAQAGGLFGGTPVDEYVQERAQQATPDAVEDAEILAVAEVVADRVAAGFAPIAEEAVPEPDTTDTTIEVPPDWMQVQYWVVGRAVLKPGQGLDKLPKNTRARIDANPLGYYDAVRDWHAGREVGNG